MLSSCVAPSCVVFASNLLQNRLSCSLSRAPRLGKVRSLVEARLIQAPGWIAIGASFWFHDLPEIRPIEVP